MAEKAIFDGMEDDCLLLSSLPRLHLAVFLLKDGLFSVFVFGKILGS